MYTGSEPGFYQWSRGVCMQANLDLLLDWAQSNGLGEVAVEHTHTLSSAINLLATPRNNLLQVTQTFMHFGTHFICILIATELAEAFGFWHSLQRIMSYMCVDALGIIEV